MPGLAPVSSAVAGAGREETVKEIGIILGLVCMGVDFYTAITGEKTLLHRVGHFGFGFVFVGLVYLVWIG